jgi:hypothetical protein
VAQGQGGVKGGLARSLSRRYGVLEMSSVPGHGRQAGAGE